MRGPSRGGILAAVVFALSVAAVTLLFWRAFGGAIPLEPEGYRFHASFAQAANLQPNADVRIAGVPVGKVVKVARVEQRADAVIELEERFAPIPADARAILRAKTLLGETFVELSPGSRNGPRLPDGGRLPTAQVAPTTQLDQLLGAFDERTRRGLKRFVLDLSTALDGRSEDLSAALGNSGPAVDELSRLIGILDEQNEAVEGLVRDTGTTLQALGRRDADLRSLVVAGDELLTATAASERDLTATVRATPQFLTDLRGALEDIGETADDVAPTLQELRATAPELHASIRQAGVLGPRLERLFGELQPVMRAARSGLPAATRILDTAIPFVQVLHPAGRELLPFYDLAAAYKREIVSSLAKGTAATQASTPRADGSRAHYIRTLMPILSESLFGYGQRQPYNRHNPYPSPGALEGMANGGLHAFDCRNTSNPQQAPPIPPGAGAPPCLAQQPWTFQGETRAFPHLERADP